MSYYSIINPTETNAANFKIVYGTINSVERIIVDGLSSKQAIAICNELSSLHNRATLDLTKILKRLNEEFPPPDNLLNTIGFVNEDGHDELLLIIQYGGCFHRFVCCQNELYDLDKLISDIRELL